MQGNNPSRKSATTAGRGKNKGRYAKLRPHLGKIMKWCSDGIQWVDMAKSLEAEGLQVSPASIQAGATRSGAVLIHPYSPYYDADTHAAYLAGRVSTQDLKDRVQKR